MPVNPVSPSQVQPQEIDYSSLVGTLGPLMTLMGLGQAQQQQNMDELHGQVSQAQQQAQQAGQDYQQAAQAPQPQSGGNFYDQLLGNTASVLGGNKEYGQQAYERGKQHDEDLRKSRVENLAALKANYEKAASNAEKLGNTELTAQYRTKVEQVTKGLQQLVQQGMRGQEAVTTEANKQGGRMELQGLKGQQAKDQIRLRGLQAVDLQKLKNEGKIASTEEEAILGQAVTTTSTGYQVLNLSGLVGNSKNKAIMWAMRNDMPALSAADVKVLQDIQGARDNIDDIMANIEDKLAQDPTGRLASMPGVRLSAMLQTDDDRAAFAAWRTAAIKNLRATAGSGGLRINQAEIELAVQNDIPRITDTVSAARQKMDNVRTMLDNAEKPLATHDWRRGVVPKNKVSTDAGPAGESKLSDEEAYKRYQAIKAGKK